MSYSDPVEHKSMALDAVRNGYYEKALSSVLTSDSVVLDAGAGIGVLGLMAAKLGARRVFLVEPAADLESARRLAKANGVADRVEFFEATVERVELPEPVDVITSVFTGNFLLEEDLLPSLFVARDRFLKPGGTLIPGQGRMMILPVSMPAYYEQQIECWGSLGHIDHSAMREFAVNRLYHGDFSDQDHRCLSQSAVLKTIDFYSATEAACRETHQFVVERDGELHGFLGWFDINFGHAWLSTAPGAEKTHWSQVFLPLPSPVFVKEGDSIDLKLDRPQFGEWSWVVSTGDFESKQSTFLGAPITPQQLKLGSHQHHPLRSRRGDMMVFVLESMNGTDTSENISARLFQQFPSEFADEEAAKRFVVELVRQCGR